MPENENDDKDKGIPFPIVGADDNSDDSNDDAGQDDSGASGDSEAKPEEKLISQEELERILKKRLKRQEDQFNKQFGDYDKLKEAAEAYEKIQSEKSTDAERWEKREKELLASLSERDEKLTKLERTNLVADLATDSKLPKKLWQYVQGDDADSIEESINAIKTDFEISDSEGDGDRPSKTPSKQPAKKGGAMYGGGGENESPDPDTDAIVSKIPRGPQFRLEKPRTYK